MSPSKQSKTNWGRDPWSENIQKKIIVLAGALSKEKILNLSNLDTNGKKSID